MFFRSGILPVLPGTPHPAIGDGRDRLSQPGNPPNVPGGYVAHPNRNPPILADHRCYRHLFPATQRTLCLFPSSGRSLQETPPDVQMHITDDEPSLSRCKGIPGLVTLAPFPQSSWQNGDNLSGWRRCGSRRPNSSWPCISDSGLRRATAGVLPLQHLSHETASSF
ncbi:hypothetical protein VTI74DRAFT_1525 [Chaetomium olivicolor]